MPSVSHLPHHSHCSKRLAAPMPVYRPQMAWRQLLKRALHGRRQQWYRTQAAAAAPSQAQPLAEQPEELTEQAESAFGPIEIAETGTLEPEIPLEMARGTLPNPPPRTFELGRESPRAPDALPMLPAHLQYMADRPWVKAMQLRWIRSNLMEERTEKREYAQQLWQQQSYTIYSQTAMSTHINRLQNEVAELDAKIASCNDALSKLQQTECWRPR